MTTTTDREFLEEVLGIAGSIEHSLMYLEEAITARLDEESSGLEAVLEEHRRAFGRLRARIAGGGNPRPALSLVRGEGDA